MNDRYFFLAIAEHGDFSPAAKRICVTQPTLSAGIVRLEGQSGARLFDRDRKKVARTPAGSRFLVRARGIAAENKDSQNACRRRGLSLIWHPRSRRSRPA
jgi:DNA-binding transcriptional LysR family regulator